MTQFIDKKTGASLVTDRTAAASFFLADLPELCHPDYALRLLQPADSAAWYEYLAMPEVYQHTSWNLHSAADLQSVFAHCNQPGEQAQWRFALIVKSTGALAGTIGFHSRNMLNRSAELAYDLHPAHWHRGLASTAAQALLHWGFGQQKMLRIQATVLPENLPSIAVLQRIGMHYEGRLRHFRLVRGAPRDYLLYAAIAADFQDSASE